MCGVRGRQVVGLICDTGLNSSFLSVVYTSVFQNRPRYYLDANRRALDARKEAKTKRGDYSDRWGRRLPHGISHQRRVRERQSSSRLHEVHCILTALLYYRSEQDDDPKQCLGNDRWPVSRCYEDGWSVTEERLR